MVNEDLEQKVQQRTQDIREILDNVRHGFLLVGQDRCIGKSFSASCSAIFRTENLADRDIADLFQFEKETRAMFILACEQIFDNFLPLEVTTALVPQRFTVSGRIYSLSVSAIANENKDIKRLLFSISDITDLENLLKENKLHRSLLKIIAHKDSFLRFTDETEQCLQRAAKAIATSDFQNVRMQLHTIKGNALMFGLDEFAHIIHELETQSSVTLEELDTLRTTLEAFIEANDDVLHLKSSNRTRVMLTEESLAHHWGQMQTAGNLAAALDIFRNLMHESRLKSAKELLGILPGQVQVLAQKLGKEVVVNVIGGHILLNPAEVGPLIAQLSHALRNSVDHGIEPPEERNDKPTPARIEIEFHDTHDHWSIRISDDGRGLDPETIRRRAVEKGLATAEQVSALPVEAIHEFIFATGFSTKDAANEISGRGLGMAALRQSVQNLGGTIKIESEAGKGITLILQWPRTGLRQAA